MEIRYPLLNFIQLLIISVFQSSTPYVRIGAFKKNSQRFQISTAEYIFCCEYSQNHLMIFLSTYVTCRFENTGHGHLET